MSLENLDVRGRHLASPSSFGGLGTGPMDPPELLKVRTGSWPRRRCWQAENVGTELSRTKVLFVCDQNRLRSPTAEALFAGDPTLEVRSAGCRTDATAPITREALEWADVIFVMERNQRNVIRKRFEDIYQPQEDHLPLHRGHVRIHGSRPGRAPNRTSAAPPACATIAMRRGSLSV